MAEKKWARRINRRLRRKAMEQEAGSCVWHSGSYHRHFEDYTEYQKVMPDGRKRLVREYTGDWYRQNLGTGGYLGLRLAYLLAFVAMAGLMARAGALEKDLSTPWYLAVAQFGTLLALAYLFYVLAAGYLFAPRKMTVGDYRCSSCSLKRAAACAAACFGADALFEAISVAAGLAGGGLSGAGSGLSGAGSGLFGIGGGLSGTGSGLFGVGGGSAEALAAAVLPFLAGAAIGAGMFLAETHVPYQKLKNDTVPAQEGCRITSA